MKPLIFFCLLFNTLLLVEDASAQEPDHLCGYDLARKHLQQAHPDYARATDQFFRRGIASANQANQRNGEIYTIPVVVHVVWKNDAQNISDERIYSQMEVLNEDFRNTNEESAELREEFVDIIGDARIEFELINIIRVPTDKEFNWAIVEDSVILPDQVKFSEQGGSDVVEPEQYFNVWVCELRNGLRGYAYPPGDLSNWPSFEGVDPSIDGAVVDYRYFGRYSDDNIDSDGRLMVHEVGHYLGLRHIWGDGNCDSDDGIEDTPTANAPNRNCNFGINSCEESIERELPDMIENHMDYTRCRHAFTKGQIGLMRFVLENRRFKLRPPIPTDETRVSLFPNPSSGLFNVFVDESFVYEQIRVFTSLGQEVIVPVADRGSRNSYTVDLRGFPQGIYFIKFSRPGIVVSKRVALSY